MICCCGTNFPSTLSPLIMKLWAMAFFLFNSIWAGRMFISICWLQTCHRSRGILFTFFSFFGQTFRTLTCVHPSPMDNIQSDWAWSPFIPITIHLCTFVPFPAHPPIQLPTPSVCPKSFFLDTLGPGLQGLSPKGGIGTSYG